MKEWDIDLEEDDIFAYGRDMQTRAGCAVQDDDSDAKICEEAGYGMEN